jgi:hypothetical protein
MNFDYVIAIMVWLSLDQTSEWWDKYVTTYACLEVFDHTIRDFVWWKQPKLIQLYIEYINQHEVLIC